MLRIEGLRRRIGRFALRVDELRVRRGDYMVLLGPSGAGKTMLLETIAGLHPASGRVWIDDRDASHLPPEARTIGLLYQDCWLFPHLSVRENIDFGRRYRRGAGSAPAPHTDELAGMLHISDLLSRLPRTLSGGERQRVALARALAIRPKLLLLDEPLGPLDPVNREHIASELRQLTATLGLTTVHVTHDHTEARMMGDVVAVMRQGTIEQVGRIEEVFQRPQTAQLARFLGCENLFAAEALPGPCPELTEVRLAYDVSLMVHSIVRGKILVCVRPEDLRIRPASRETITESRNPAIGLLDPSTQTDSADCESSATPSGIAGTVSGRIVVYSRRGPLVRLEVEIAVQRWVVLTATSELAALRLGVNDWVRLDVPAAAVHLIPAG